MKRRLISMCIVFALLFGGGVSSQLEVSSIHSYARPMIKKKLKSQTKKSNKKASKEPVWKTVTKEDLLQLCYDEYWDLKYPDRRNDIFKRGDYSNGRCGGSIIITDKAIRSSHYRIGEDVPEYTQSVINVFKAVIPNGAEEIIKFVEKVNEESWTMENRCFYFENVDGASVLINQRPAFTEIEIYYSPKLPKEAFDYIKKYFQ